MEKAWQERVAESIREMVKRQETAARQPQDDEWHDGFWSGVGVGLAIAVMQVANRFPELRDVMSTEELHAIFTDAKPTWMEEESYGNKTLAG